MKERPAPEWQLDSGRPMWPSDEHPLMDVVRDCVEELDDEDRQLLLEWAYERLTLREIAESRGLGPRSSAHYRLKRSLEKLEKIFADHGLTSASFPL